MLLLLEAETEPVCGKGIESRVVSVMVTVMTVSTTDWLGAGAEVATETGAEATAEEATETGAVVAAGAAEAAAVVAATAGAACPLSW